MPIWKIQKVRIEELETYFQEHPLHPDSVRPISPERIQSYLHNPRAKKSDIVLYFVLNDEKVIAFRTVWADEYTDQHATTRFGWCSGNWVAPEYRRQGLSMLLMKEMIEDWDRKLCFTNYAPESEAGYLKSGYFNYSIQRKGKRFYYRVSLFELFSGRKVSFAKKIVLWGSNLLFQLAGWFRSIIFREYDTKNWTFAIVSVTSAILPEYAQNCFKRDAEIFAWIVKYPWLKQGVKENTNYPFSWNVKSFEKKLLTVSTPDGSEGSLFFSVREGKVKILYWSGKEKTIPVLLKQLINYCFQIRCKTITILDEELAGQFSSLHTPFVYSKAITMNIYATFDISRCSGEIYDGDGDYCFT